MKNLFWIFILCLLAPPEAHADGFPAEPQNKTIGVQLGTTGADFCPEKRRIKNSGPGICQRTIRHCAVPKKIRL